MLAIYNDIVIFLVYSQFGANWKPDFGRRVDKTYIFIKSNFSLTKTENETKKSLTQIKHYCFK